MLWSVSTGMIARLLNTRGTMGWNVPFVGHPSLSSGEIGSLVTSKENWANVYAIGYKSCSFDANGKLPPRSADFVARLKGKVELSDTLLWWVAAGYDAINMVAKAVDVTGSSSSEAIIGYWNTLKPYPGVFGNYSYSPDQHNGYPTEEVVMSAANSAKDGSFTLAPGY